MRKANLLMNRKFTVCMAVHFTDAQKLCWMHGCPSSRIICVHALHGAHSWVNKKIPCYLVNQITGILFPHFITYIVCDKSVVFSRISSLKVSYYFPLDLSGFRSVSITLSSSDIYTTVQSVLEACALPTALVRQFKEENDSKGGAFPRSVEWHSSYYTYTGKKNPHERVQQRQKKPEITLR